LRLTFQLPDYEHGESIYRVYLLFEWEVGMEEITIPVAKSNERRQCYRKLLRRKAPLRAGKRNFLMAVV